MGAAAPAKLHKGEGSTDDSQQKRERAHKATLIYFPEAGQAFLKIYRII